MKIIDCRQIAKKIEDEIAQGVYEHCANPSLAQPQRRPVLAIVKVGQRPDSDLYVKIKERQAKSVGIETSLYLFNENASQEELITAIKFLDQDQSVDGILVQLPLPAQLDADKILAQMSAAKDIDGFHPDNLAKLANLTDPAEVISPVYAGILACLAKIDCDLKSKQVVIIGKSEIFTRNLDLMLEALGAQVQVFKADEAWQKASKQAEVIISAVGQAGLVKAEQVKPGAVIIDIGISQVSGKTCGDVDAESLSEVDGYLTPVPGGMGPLTVALALKNTWRNYLKTLEHNE